MFYKLGPHCWNYPWLRKLIRNSTMKAMSAEIVLLTELYSLRNTRKSSQFVSHLQTLICSFFHLDFLQWSSRNQMSSLHLALAQTCSTEELSWGMEMRSVRVVIKCNNLPWALRSNYSPLGIFSVPVIFLSSKSWWNRARCSLYCFDRGVVRRRNDLIVELK